MSTRTIPASEQTRRDGAGKRLDRELAIGDGTRRSQIAGEDADAVAAHLRLAAVGIEDPHARDGLGEPPP